MSAVQFERSSGFHSSRVHIYMEYNDHGFNLTTASSFHVSIFHNLRYVLSTLDYHEAPRDRGRKSPR